MTRQSIVSIAVAAGVLVCVGTPASAHHSGAMFEPEKTITLKVQKRNKETGAVHIEEIEVHDRDPQAANKALELLARHLGLFEEDNAQAGKAAAVAVEQITDFERARRIVWILQRGAAAAADATNLDDGHSETRDERAKH